MIEEMATSKKDRQREGRIRDAEEFWYEIDLNLKGGTTERPGITGVIAGVLREALFRSSGVRLKMKWTRRRRNDYGQTLGLLFIEAVRKH